MKGKVLATDSAYIDPLHCDSIVSYKILEETWEDSTPELKGVVNLSDCSRRIEWYFNEEESAVEKIDKALEILKEFRDKYATELNKKSITQAI